MSVFSHFSIGISALRAFRLGMNMAGYNVANAETEGFSRRRIQLGMMPTVEIPGGLAGMGVEVTSVRRMRDTFLDFATRREMGRLGSDSGRNEVLSALEPMLGEVGSAALSTSLTGIFDAFEQLAVEPDSTAVREDVIAAARELAGTIRRVDSYFVESRRNANEKVESLATRANEILDRLEQINRDIVGQEVDGTEASDMRDERDRLLDELAVLLPVRTVESANGQLSVYLEGTGDTLLSGVSARPLQLATDTDGMNRVRISRGGEIVDLTDVLRDGELGGFLEVRDEAMPGYREKLDQFTKAVIDQFNTVHRAGYDLNGDQGGSLFEPDPPGSHPSSAIYVNAQIEQNSQLLAAAGAAGEPGSNVNALAFVDLRDASVAALGNRTLVGFGADILSQVGRDVSAADVALKASRVIVDSLELKRQEASAVSLDEEAADLARWQQSFQAAAQFMQTVNRVTEIAINMFAG